MKVDMLPVLISQSTVVCIWANHSLLFVVIRMNYSQEFGTKYNGMLSVLQHSVEYKIRLRCLRVLTIS